MTLSEQRTVAAAVAAALVAALLVTVSRPAEAGEAPLETIIAFETFRNGSQDIYTMKPDGSDQQVLVDDAFDPAISPDGSKVVYTKQRDGSLRQEIHVINADGTGDVNLTQNDVEDYNPAWSGDGTRIVFVTQEFSLNAIAVVDADGSDQEIIVSPLTGNEQLAEPDWSPDNSKIVFTSTRDGSRDLWTVDPDGTDLLQITDTNSSTRHPNWSPDGSKIAFSEELGVNEGIFTVLPGGTGYVQIPNTTDRDYDPSWSPDGTQIAFTSLRDTCCPEPDPDLKNEIWRMDADGSDQVRLTNDLANDITPDWGLVADCVGHPFSDVLPWVDPAVDWAFCGSYLSGYPNNTFRPDNNMTRAQVANLLHGLEGDQPPGSGCSGLTDVPPWAEDAICWLVNSGYASGYPDMTFRPNEPISRAQVARMLFRVAGEPPGSPANTFSDVPPWVEAAVDWLTDPVNVPPYASGYPNGTFKPNDDISRAQITRMTCRINADPGTC